jgi:hypothetical protein
MSNIELCADIVRRGGGFDVDANKQIKYLKAYKERD